MTASPQGVLIEARIPFGYIARKAWRDITTVLVISAVVELVVYYHRSYLPEVPAALPALLGTAISLLLSFKLAQSYDRWWEARKIWGAIVNDSRSLVRQLLAFATGDRDIVERMARRQIGWCYCLGQSLRALDWREQTIDHLSPEDATEAERHANKPLALLQLQARDLRALSEAERVTDYQRVAIDNILTRLTDSMGKAERIKNTVFPKTYRLFTHGFVYLFITLLSIALAEVEGAWQLLLTTLIAIPFFLLEKTAKHMQDPFSNRPNDTAMTAIARTIDINLRQLIGDDEVPTPWPANGYYLM